MSRVAVLQLNSKASVQENLATLPNYFTIASQSGASLLVLPENFSFMGKHEHDKLSIAESYGSGEIQDTLKKLAKTFNLWVVAGTIPIKSSTNRVYASSLVYNYKGECIARYDKIHLFDVKVSENEAHCESKTIEYGKDIVVVDTPVGCIGLSVCYDVRFPELYRQLVKKGAQILSIPSAFTATTGQAHWEVLVRARAIENLCYVLASNQGGIHESGRTTYGHSMIVDPWGKIVSEIKDGCGIIIGDVDLKQLNNIRQQFPCNEHHRI